MQIRQSLAVIESQLQAVGTDTRAKAEKRYLKSDLDFLGVAVPEIRRQARIWSKSHPEVDKDQTIRLVRALWRRRVHELRTFGVELLSAYGEVLAAADFGLVEWILGRANTWAHVDPVAVQIAGPLVDRFPELESDLDLWAVNENFWMRRSALLAHLLPLRRGKGDWDRFARYAGEMLEEKEFFIRKAIGWVLREAGQIMPARVVNFLDANMARISGVSLREAVKHLDADDRNRLLEAYRNR